MSWQELLVLILDVGDGMRQHMEAASRMMFLLVQSKVDSMMGALSLAFMLVGLCTLWISCTTGSQLVVIICSCSSSPMMKSVLSSAAPLVCCNHFQKNTAKENLELLLSN